MRRRRQAWHIAALAALLAALPSVARTQVVDTAAAGRPDGGVRLRLPAQVADFQLRGQQREPNGAEVLLRFAGPDSVRADVFLYPGPDFAHGCDSVCAAQLLEAEVADFRSLFPEMIRRRYVDSIAVESDEAVPPSGPGTWRLGRRLVMATRHAGQAERSELHLFYLPGLRVKIRVSYAPTAERMRVVDAFAAALVPALLRSDDGPPRT